MDDIREIFESEGRAMEAIKLVSPDRLLVWDKSGKAKGDTWTGMTGWNEEKCKAISLEEIDLDILQSMKVWNSLSNEVKDKMLHLVRLEKQETHELMAKARASRKKKYENIPEELTCSICKTMVEAVPSKIAGICNRKNILLDDYLKGFKCKKCNPIKRGKQANPEFAKLPKTIKCGCGYETNVNPYQLKIKAEKVGVSIEELIKSYKCQKCNPTKGRKKGSK